MQVWATWFPKDGKPQSFIQGFPLADLDLSARGRIRSTFGSATMRFEENSCRGALEVTGTLDFMGPAITFDVSCHAEQQGLDWFLANAAFGRDFFPGEITLDGRRFAREPSGVWSSRA